MPDAKISIIVPVYKVEPYLRKCLDSIVGQTYQNLEIILVDDGSPDNCGAICDAYAARDERIRVIHKANGGVASARNAGLDTATGDYIGWVDSDDWIEADMFECLLKGAETYGADIVVCGRAEVYPDRKNFMGWERETVLSREEAIGHLLEDNAMRNYLCDKLWKRELFQNITFPEGHNFEDVAVTYRLFEKADKVACLPECKYFYLQREDGIVRSKALSNIMDYYEATKERYLYLRDRYPRFRERMEGGLVLAAANTWAVFLSAPPELQRRHREQLKEMAAFVREHPVAVAAAARDLGLAGRLRLRLSRYPYRWACALVWCVDRLYEARHGRSL